MNFNIFDDEYKYEDKEEVKYEEKEGKLSNILNEEKDEQIFNILKNLSNKIDTIQEEFKKIKTKDFEKQINEKPNNEKQINEKQINEKPNNEKQINEKPITEKQIIVKQINETPITEKQIELPIEKEINKNIPFLKEYINYINNTQIEFSLKNIFFEENIKKLIKNYDGKDITLIKKIIGIFYSNNIFKFSKSDLHNLLLDFDCKNLNILELKIIEKNRNDKKSFEKHIAPIKVKKKKKILKNIYQTNLLHEKNVLLDKKIKKEDFQVTFTNYFYHLKKNNSKINKFEECPLIVRMLQLDNETKSLMLNDIFFKIYNKKLNENSIMNFLSLFSSKLQLSTSLEENFPYSADEDSTNLFEDSEDKNLVADAIIKEICKGKKESLIKIQENYEIIFTPQVLLLKTEKSFECLISYLFILFLLNLQNTIGGWILFFFFLNFYIIYKVYGIYF